MLLETTVQLGLGSVFVGFFIAGFLKVDLPPKPMNFLVSAFLTPVFCFAKLTKQLL